jgi:hypothetical protein
MTGKKEKASPDFDNAALGKRDPDAVAALESLLAEGFRVQNSETRLLLVNSATGEAAAVNIFPRDGRASTVQRGPIAGKPSETQTAHDYLADRKPSP